jgi:hypothetical protein
MNLTVQRTAAAPCIHFVVFVLCLLVLGCDSGGKAKAPDGGSDTETGDTDTGTATDTGTSGDYWIDGTCNEIGPSSDDCNGIPYEGCCDADANVVWCAGGLLYCASCDDTCGWNLDAWWYDCGFEGPDPWGNFPYQCVSDCSDIECELPCVRFVDRDVAASGDGLGWSTAFSSVQPGIYNGHHAAECCDTTCQVWVAEGVYYIYKSNVSDRLWLWPFVEVYGGFAGTESLLEERDWITHETVLDAREGDAGDNHVNLVVEARDGAMIDGFTITGGRGALGWGGGAGSVVFSHCRFNDNEGADWGGGLTVLSGAAEIKGCRFEGNTADLGGGVTGLASEITLSNSVFVGNSAYEGGAILLVGSEASSVSGCSFLSNQAELGGAISNVSSTTDIINCTFFDNQATQTGGALVNSFPGTSPRVVNCVMWGDTPDEIADLHDGSLEVTYSDVQGGWPGDGNIDADPLFVDTLSGDLSLGAGSPCIDAANGDLSVLECLDDPGVSNTGVGDPVYCDIGAFEYQPE